MKLEVGQEWKTRNGGVVVVSGSKPDCGGRPFFFVDGNDFVYADESDEGIFYVFDADLLNGQDLVELIREGD